MRAIKESKATSVLVEGRLQPSAEIAVERWENEGGPEKVEISAVVALYNTCEEAKMVVRELQKTEGEKRKLTIVGALENAAEVGEQSALNAQLINLGIPAESVAEYETQINAGKFALVAQGSVNEVGQTQDALAVSPYWRISKPTRQGSAGTMKVAAPRNER